MQYATALPPLFFISSTTLTTTSLTHPVLLPAHSTHLKLSSKPHIPQHDKSNTISPSLSFRAQIQHTCGKKSNPLKLSTLYPFPLSSLRI